MSWKTEEAELRKQTNKKKKPQKTEPTCMWNIGPIQIQAIL
jgi:hypothetical protein